MCVSVKVSVCLQSQSAVSLPVYNKGLRYFRHTVCVLCMTETRVIVSESIFPDLTWAVALRHCACRSE